MMRGSDEELMLSFRNGNVEAFEALYRRYEKPLLNFLFRIVMNAEDAENLCQETFFRIVRAKKEYEATALFKTWLYQIALNLCRDRMRRMKHRSHLSLNAQVSFQYDGDVELHELISDPASDLDKHVETIELGALVQKAIACLPEDEHLVISLREYQGLKLSEIADIMNCPIGTIKSLNHRACMKLKNYLARYIGD
jgi:RNA polymerase sigma-70 factor (ECF subfamily)